MKNNRLWHPATVRALRDLTPTVREFEIRPEGGVKPWTVGSHLNVQVFVDGREWRAWYRGGAMPDGAQVAAPGLHLSALVPANGPVQVELAIDDAGNGNWQAYFALVEDGLSSTVQAGENRGRVLRHRHVARAWAGPMARLPARTQLAAPAGLVRENAAVVAFVENPDSGRVGQVVRLSLAGCAATQGE